MIANSYVFKEYIYALCHTSYFKMLGARNLKSTAFNMVLVSPPKLLLKFMLFKMKGVNAQMKYNVNQSEIVQSQPILYRLQAYDYYLPGFKFFLIIFSHDKNSTYTATHAGKNLEKILSSTSNKILISGVTG